MVAPAAFQIAEEFHITSSVEISLTISVFVLAYGEDRTFFAIVLCHIDINDYSQLLAPYFLDL